jgi:predicted O-linked N-acetylglucosamine transferase (SPINDLY family)
MSPGRNDPCPCGSGRKYKHCHGAIAPTSDPPPAAAKVDVKRSLQQARSLHLKGFLPEAEALYLEVLKHSPRQADAKNLLGVLCAQRDDPASALVWIGEAIAIDPRNPAYRFNYGKTLLQVKRPREACQALERATALRGDQAETHNELGLARMDDGNLTAATAAFRRALSLQPDYMEAHNNLALALHRQGEYDEAGASLRRALELEPQSTEVMGNLGMVLRAQGRAAEAVETYRAALVSSPREPVTLTNLGNALIDLSRHEEAIACFREAIAVAPDYAEAHYNWGTAHLRADQFQAAAEKFSDALARNPDFPGAAGGLGSALFELGRVEEAIQALRRALLLQPDDKDVHSFLLFSQLHSSEVTAKQIFAEHCEWARRHAARFVPGSATRRNSPEPERRLRIGYVSGDFRHHSVAQFFEPVLAQHDRGRFEIFCYSNLSFGDATTELLRGRADCWREISSLSDDAAADLVRSDGIDILVDLSGHTKYNRLLVFARKPAPVQATWLGYLNTTGLEAIDYRITDPKASPEGRLDAFHSEQLLRLPDCQWCYQPPPGCPEVSDPPAARNGFVTFGSFSSLAKIGPRVVELWCRLLELDPNARLLIVGRGLGAIREGYLSRFGNRGIAPERVDLREFQSFRNYLALHGSVDVTLDTFPYAGGTTTCHSLWMGVPVVSLAGDSPPSRGGVSLLKTVGLDELVADTPQRYLDIACDLAGDTGTLATLRTSMRARMSASPLMDAARFAHELEQAYRSMWRRWCETARSGSGT